MVESHLIPSILHVVISNCSSLYINLTDSQRPLSLLPNLTVQTSDHVYLDLANDLANLPHHIHLVNVTQVHATIPREGDKTREDLYLLLCAVLGGLLAILLLSLPLMCWCVRRKTSRDEYNKKVSRAESWRYESSMYINPAPGARHHQMNLLPLAAVNNSNSPLLTNIGPSLVTKPPLPDAVLGGSYHPQRVDIVRPPQSRTSTPSSRHCGPDTPSSRHCGPDPPHPPQPRYRPPFTETDRYYNDTTDNSSDDLHSESSTFVDSHLTATLPHR